MNFNKQVVPAGWETDTKTGRICLPCPSGSLPAFDRVAGDIGVAGGGCAHQQVGRFRAWGYLTVRKSQRDWISRAQIFRATLISGSGFSFCDAKLGLVIKCQLLINGFSKGVQS